ncbi:hypothetical protein WG904_19390 [Pedobacter sp. Du54]|uniref:hypothetical protein n=1 Tax=Pedobacter anseongensis TaxID=3133439 RepID=UPI0030A01B0B
MKLFKYGLTLTLLLIIGFACKKSVVVVDESAKTMRDWYVNSVSNSKSVMQSTDNRIFKIEQLPDWNAAKTFQLSDGKEVVGVPLKITNAEQQKIGGSFMLFITKDGNSYRSYIAHNDEESYFEKDVSLSDLEKTFKSVAEPVNHEKKSNKAKLMVEDQSEICIDWYLTTTYYDEHGGIVFQTEFYMYSTCAPVGGTGGVGGKQQMIPEEEVLDLGEPSSIDDGKDSEIEEVVGLDTFKVAPVKWKFFNALTFYAQSKERIVVKVNNGNRVITDIHHDGHRLIGEIPGVKITVQQPLFTPYHGDHNAVMEVDYTMHWEGKGALSWLDSHMPDVYSVGQWNEYFQKIN